MSGNSDLADGAIVTIDDLESGLRYCVNFVRTHVGHVDCAQAHLVSTCDFVCHVADQGETFVPAVDYATFHAADIAGVDHDVHDNTAAPGDDIEPNALGARDEAHDEADQGGLEHVDRRWFCSGLFDVGFSCTHGVSRGWSGGAGVPRRNRGEGREGTSHQQNTQILAKCQEGMT